MPKQPSWNQQHHRTHGTTPRDWLITVGGFLTIICALGLLDRLVN